MKKTITVEGTGRVKTKPDLILMEFRLHSEDKDYEKAMALSDSHYEKLIKSLTNAGFALEDLKTKELKVLTQYNQEHDGKVYHQVFKGYEISYHLELSFGMDLKRLNALLGEIAKEGSTPEFSILFEVAKDKELKKEALARAAKEAKGRAEALAKAMGLKLGLVKEMRTLDSQTGFTSKIQYPTMQMRAMDVNLTPQDVENVEKVQITFYIL